MTKYAWKTCIVMKKFVFRNNKGFTMLEMLLSLAFLMIILALIPFLIQSIYALKENAFNHSEYELIMFRKDIIEETKEAEIKLNQDHNKIIFTHKHSSSEYTLLNSKIYKSINGRGNITLLNKVKSFKINKNDNGNIQIDLEIIKGRITIRETIFI